MWKLPLFSFFPFLLNTISRRAVLLLPLPTATPRFARPPLGVPALSLGLSRVPISGTSVLALRPLMRRHREETCVVARTGESGEEAEEEGEGEGESESESESGEEESAAVVVVSGVKHGYHYKFLLSVGTLSPVVSRDSSPQRSTISRRIEIV